ncbi:uncharacterized protein A1O5_12736 [Cladophialophora psammophila CBS 110553]|uniref:Uncharacterized protein n=1 Tax=Cladophialophora psammophila CBS 110553 TaxID=1182543 RepID=W9VH74_9EURO|nr:uncharacterized protein A1O5_12736 [Cladophialophora psammophila CBS 110553]EXJ54997.1 hypothetical protein A1O5_12736 [Cladophialophora psammophila CBS 110553]
MTIRKQYPSRNYETFPDDNDDSNTQSPTSYQRGGDADKSRSAAAEAQRLGSQGSWADNFAGGTPATNRTPTASTVDGDEVRDLRYPPHLSSDGDPSDPPPVYTPSASTQVGSQSPAAPASPVAARPNLSPVPEPTMMKRRVHRLCPKLSRMIITLDTITIISTTTIMIITSTKRMQTQIASPCSCNSIHATREHGVGHLEKREAAVVAAAAADGRYQLPSFGSRPSQTPWPPPKREHREHETFRSISGTYQLYDLLDLSTTAGSVAVTVEVQPGDKPAVLRLSTTAGSVNVKMISGGGFFTKPTIPDAAKSRTLMTEISTGAGSISGNVVHGNGGSTSVSTNAGSISLTIFAVGVSEMDPQSNISTISNQGSQHIKVVPSLGSTEAIRAIEAVHTVRGSGSMNIAYPPQWEGMVHLSTYGMGSIGASGNGLVVRKESSHEVYGYRGATQGRKVEISELGNGSLKFSC